MPDEEHYYPEEHYPMWVDNLGRIPINGERTWVPESQRDSFFLRRQSRESQSFGDLREYRSFGDD